MRLKFVIVAALSWLSIMSADVQGEQSHTSEITTLIAEIVHQPDTRLRQDLAEELLMVTNRVGTSEQFDDRLIDDMASLLRDRSIRSWIAPALGMLGPRARRAVPALKKALEDEEVVESTAMLDEDEAERVLFMNRGLSVANAIRLALAKIEVPPED
jgi:hypothetical protein